MKILLLNNVKKLGSAGKVVEVKTGYAVNFLLPKKLATTDLTAKVSSKKGREISEEDAKVLLKKLVKSKLEIAKKASAKGTFFSAVSEEEIAHAVEQKISDFKNTGYSIKILEPIKKAGIYKAAFSLKGIRVPIKISAVAEEEDIKKPAKKTVRKKKKKTISKKSKKISKKTSSKTPKKPSKKS